MNQSQHNMVSNKSNRDLEMWLHDKVNDKYIEDVYDKSDIKNHYGGDYDEKQFYKYHKKDDIDIKLSLPENESLLCIDTENKKYIYEIAKEYGESYEKNVVEVMERYGDKIISHNPSSNIAHTSTLFKRLIDCCEHNKLGLSVPNIDKTNTVTSVGRHEIINLSMKKAFYEFCKDNTF